MERCAGALYAALKNQKVETNFYKNTSSRGEQGVGVDVKRISTKNSVKPAIFKTDVADYTGKFNQKCLMRLVRRFFPLADLLASSFAASQFEKRENAKEKTP